MAKLNKADAMALISSFHRHGQCAQAVSVRRAFRRGCAGSAAQSLSSQCASGCTATVRRAFRRGSSGRVSHTWPRSATTQRCSPRCHKCDDLVALHMLWHGVTPGPVR